MTFDDYQADAGRTINRDLSNDDLIINSALGMAGEAGEVADRIKKWLYQGHTFDRDALINESGDLLWYIAQLATALDVPLSEIAARNIAKLKARYPAGFDAQRSINRADA
jgi:NTP pyrophosphatase (non-canonical NTP hydrolase)